MTDRYERIREALKMEPTPGPWDGNEYSVSKLWSNGEVGIREYIAFPDNTEDANPNPADMHWIAACDPYTIRELLAERDALVVENDALAAEIERLREAMEMSRAVLAQSITAGHNVPGPTPEDIERAFWALDTAITASDAKQ